MQNLNELQETVQALAKALGIVGLIADKDPEDKELADVRQSVYDAYMKLSERLQTFLTAQHLADLKNRSVAELTQPRDLDWERARR